MSRTASGIILPTFPERTIETRYGKVKRVEYKIIAGSLKATNDEQGIVEGYLNAIGNVDYGLDRTMPGAFKRTLDLSYKRKKANGDQFLWPYLWNHDTNLLPPGGIFDAEEDKKGLFIKAQLNLDYQLGRDMYSSYKFGSLKKQSMGYIPHQTEYTREDGQLVRDLIEVEILEGSGVIFPMNNESDVTTVKSAAQRVQRYWQGVSMERKTICGNTSGAIGPRDESWDSGKAEKQIWAAAYDDDSGKINTTLAKKYFMICEGDAQQKGSYSYPFWYVGDDDPHICVGAVTAIAAAIQGARGANAPDGLKSKVSTLYTRINKKYPDDPQLTPPWSDDGGKARGRRFMHFKDFNDHYREEVIEDWMSTDFWNLVTALKQSLMDMFEIGDEPQSDVETTVLNDGDDSPGFITALKAWVQKGIDIGVSDYLNELQQNNPYGSSDYLYYMSRQLTPNRKAMKAGASFSQANTDALYQHMSALHSMADEQCKAMHDAADALQESLTGLGSPSDPSYLERGQTGDIDGGNSNNPKTRRRARMRKAGAEFSADNLQMLSEHVGDLHDVADTIHQMAEDLAQNTGASTYDDSDGNADDAKETDKNKANSRTALGRKHSPYGTAYSTGDLSIGDALAGLRNLTNKK